MAEGVVGRDLDADYDLKQRHRRAQRKNRPKNGLFAFGGGFVYNVSHLSALAGKGDFTESLITLADGGDIPNGYHYCLTRTIRMGKRDEASDVRNKGLSR